MVLLCICIYIPNKGSQIATDHISRKSAAFRLEGIYLFQQLFFFETHIYKVSSNAKTYGMIYPQVVDKFQASSASRARSTAGSK